MADKIFTGEVAMPEGIEARLEGMTLIIKGAKGEAKKNIENPILNFSIKEKNVSITTIRATKREKKLLHTYKAHVKNMIKGCSEGHHYLLKICSSHFPMNVAVANNQFVIKNFLGEKHPRTLAIKEGVTVKVEGDMIRVESVSKDLAGTTASDIEKLTRRPNFDTRIFQDGIYLIEKDGKVLK
ncbi:50S ribosomal protein L6 [Candidatus Woesearchaeota archaeon]|nr:50S ribosomal protein L6 [Candidatus Woesearchaeota archaeon]